MLTLQGDSNPYHVDFSTELLKCPHDMVADFPQSFKTDSKEETTMPFYDLVLDIHHPFCSILLIKNESLKKKNESLNMVQLNRKGNWSPFFLTHIYYLLDNL